jgi:NTP pyrophosphatase (non-canonical NTP hydrolase)
MDGTTTFAELKGLVGQFVSERSWEKFHSPKSLSMAIAAEAAELMELFTWLTEAESYEAAQASRAQATTEELADVVIFVLAFANRCNIDLAQAIEDKIARNRERYPAQEFQGRV